MVRTAIALGYSGYPELQKAIQKVVRDRLVSMARLRVEEQSGKPSGKIYEEVHVANLQNLDATYNLNPPESLSQAAKLILEARKIGILGSRLSWPVAAYLAFYLMKLLGTGEILDQGSETLSDRLRSLSTGDLLIAIAFQNYSRQTIRAAEIAKERGVSVLGITDSLVSPLAPRSDVALFAASPDSGVIRSLVGPIALAEQLMAVVVKLSPQRFDQTLADLYDVYTRLNF